MHSAPLLFKEGNTAVAVSPPKLGGVPPAGRGGGIDWYTLVMVKLHTGRTHQIRVHLSNSGHPVFGDETYGGRVPHSINLTNNLRSQINNLLELMPRQALHAKVLGFVHPRTKEKLFFESELPPDMSNIVSILKPLKS